MGVIEPAESVAYLSFKRESYTEPWPLLRLFLTEKAHQRTINGPQEVGIIEEIKLYISHKKSGYQAVSRKFWWKPPRFLGW